MLLSENIKRLRYAKGMTLEEVGKRISVSKQTIQRYESGQIPNIPYDKVIALAEVFDCSPSELMGWDNGLNKTNAGLCANVFTDTLLSEHVEKLKKLSKEHKQTIYDNIDFWFEKEGH
mgnify:CR=1 FL=1